MRCTVHNMISNMTGIFFIYLVDTRSTLPRDRVRSKVSVGPLNLMPGEELGLKILQESSALVSSALPM